MTPKLYMADFSPPVRGVLITAKALGVTLEHKEVDLINGDHLKPEFLKLNPQHTVPTLDDKGLIIWDSHAINAYLVGKYGKNDSLYPKALEKRVVVDQRLYFDTGSAFPALIKIVRPLLKEGENTIPLESVESVKNDVYAILEKLLETRTWLAGDSVTIADHSLLATVSTLNVVVPIEGSRFPTLSQWLKRGHELPYFKEANGPGLARFEKMIAEILNKA